MLMVQKENGGEDGEGGGWGRGWVGGGGGACAACVNKEICVNVHWDDDMHYMCSEGNLYECVTRAMTCATCVVKEICVNV